MSIVAIMHLEGLEDHFNVMVQEAIKVGHQLGWNSLGRGPSRRPLCIAAGRLAARLPVHSCPCLCHTAIPWEPAVLRRAVSCSGSTAVLRRPPQHSTLAPLLPQSRTMPPPTPLPARAAPLWTPGPSTRPPPRCSSRACPACSLPCRSCLCEQPTAGAAGAALRPLHAPALLLLAGQLLPCDAVQLC